MHSELEEQFLRKPSKVDDLYQFIFEIEQKNKMDKNRVIPDISADVTDTNFMVIERGNFESVKRSKHSSRKNAFDPNLNQMTFMRQIDVSPEERDQVRMERVYVADNYRRLGNAEFRKQAYDQAIEFYTKSLAYICDSPVLFVNRSLCYIKKYDYKRALLDLEHVICYLDGRCLRAWLYRAGALKRMNNEVGFEECIQNARRYNSDKKEYIDNFLQKMNSDF